MGCTGALSVQSIVSAGPEGLVLEVGLSSDAILQHLTRDSRFPAPHRLTSQCICAEVDQTWGSDAHFEDVKPHSNPCTKMSGEKFFALSTKISLTF